MMQGSDDDAPLVTMPTAKPANGLDRGTAPGKYDLSEGQFDVMEDHKATTDVLPFAPEVLPPPTPPARCVGLGRHLQRQSGTNAARFA
jgi:hypothetical protein